MIKLIKVPPDGKTLEMRLAFGGTFMMFPPVIKMGSYLILIEDVADSDQEFIVYLIEREMAAQNPHRFHEIVSRHGTLMKPITTTDLP